MSAARIKELEEMVHLYHKKTKEDKAKFDALSLKVMELESDKKFLLSEFLLIKAKLDVFEALLK